MDALRSVLTNMETEGADADHTHSLIKAVEAVRVGFDAVVTDFSALPSKENVSRTKKAVEAIKAINPSALELSSLLGRREAPEFVSL
jgi:fructose/tagatose bisphosphate aldolase